MKRWALLGLAVILTIANLQAANSFHAGDEVYIRHTQEGNVYLAGGRVIVNAPVRGDLLIAGGNIIINDSIYDDLMVTGGQVMVNGYVGGDVRVFGGELILSGDVGGEVLVFSGDVIIDEEASIYGNFHAYSGNIQIKGVIKGDAEMRGGNIDLTGSILGSAKLKAAKIEIAGMIGGPALLSARELIVEDPAQFAGTVAYWNEAGPIDLQIYMRSGEAQFDRGLKFHENYRFRYISRSGWVYWLFTLLGALLFILLLVLIFPRWVYDSGLALSGSWGKFILRGILFLVGVPFAVIILTLTLIGLPFAIVLLIFYGFVLIYGSTIGAIVIASYLKRNDWKKSHVIVLALLLLVVVKFLGMIPFIGWMIVFLVMATGIGALITHAKAE